MFGLEDKIPFLTMTKSDEICGPVNGKDDSSKGFMYDDPHGNLIVWVSLWGRQKSKHWPAIYTVNLTLVLTAYQANCGTKRTSRTILNNVQPPGPGFRWCGRDPGPCISKDYFCDKRYRFNRAFQSVIFNNGQKMALRAFYFIMTNTLTLTC